VTVDVAAGESPMGFIVARWSGAGLAGRVVVLVLTGVAWAVSSLHHVLVRPDYWDPVTASDFFAVYAYSAAWLLTVAGLLILRQVAPRTGSLPAAILVVACGCALAGIANAFEDGFGFEALGLVYVVGAIVGGFGMFALALMLVSGTARRLAFVPGLGGLAMVAIMAGGGVLAIAAWGGFALLLIRERVGHRSARLA